MTVAIVAAAPASLSLAVPPTAKVSQPFNATLTALDRFGNVATSYAGTVHFSSSDLLAATLGKLPADYTFTGGDAGTHSFSVTLMTAGNQTVSATDTVNGALLNVTSAPIAVTVI